MSPTFRALAHRNYRRFAAGGLVSNTGTWMQRIAQDWLVLLLSGGSGAALGIVTGLQFLPALLLSPIAGAVADRWPKYRLLQLAQLHMALTSLVLGVLAVTGVAQVWHVYLIAVLFGIGSAFEAPTRQSFVPELVGRDDLPNAIGLNSASFNAARFVGPGLAGLLIAALGSGVRATGVVILVNAVSYGAVIYALTKIGRDLPPAPPRQPREPGMVVDGLRYVRSRPDLMLVLAIMFFVGTFGLNFQITSALMATEVYGKGAGEYGVLGSTLAIGSITGALLAARRTRVTVRLVVMGAVVFGAVEILIGLMPTYTTFALMTPLVGITSLTTMTAANAVMQTSVADELRGRVMALYLMVFMGGTPIGAPLIGWIGESFGARWTLVVGGGMSIAGTLLFSALYLHRRNRVRPAGASGGASAAPVVRPRLLARLGG